MPLGDSNLLMISDFAFAFAFVFTCLKRYFFCGFFCFVFDVFPFLGLYQPSRREGFEAEQKYNQAHDVVGPKRSSQPAEERTASVRDRFALGVFFLINNQLSERQRASTVKGVSNGL